jgi:predicted TPR repeat methyltransferase
MTSGDLLADRRLSFALMLRDGGDAEGALSVLDQALERAPDWAEARFARAETLQLLGQDEEAVAAYRAYLALDPTDRMGATARLGLLGTAAADHLPSAYVRTLFDQYAPRYEESLVAKLGYRAPVLLRAAVDALLPSDRNRLAVLDLGCGTGLAGAAFRDRADWLEGVDLAGGMIAEARRKGIYDRLTVADLLAFLATPPRRYDLIIAADVFVYLGALDPVLAAVAGALEPGGLLAFTLQKGDVAPFALGPDQRFSHWPAYVRTAATEADLQILSLDEVSYRTERERPVPGLLVTARGR